MENLDWIHRVSVVTKSFNMARILIVDDNKINQKVTAIMLKRLGYEVESVYSGEEAIQQVIELHIDLILMDMYMPGMDGTVATEKIRASGNPVPILAITGASSQEELDQCLRSGMNDTVQKPFVPEELEKKIAYWLNA